MLGSERTKLKFSHANTGVVTKARVIAKVSIGPRADLKNGEHAHKNCLLNLSDFLDEMTQYCLNFVAVKRNHLKNTDHEIVEYYRYTQTFIESYEHIKRDLKADRDESQYYQSLIKHFSVKMTFIVKNF